MFVPKRFANTGHNALRVIVQMAEVMPGNLPRISISVHGRGTQWGASPSCPIRKSLWQELATTTTNGVPGSCPQCRKSVEGVAWSGWTSDDRRRAEGVTRTPIELIGDWLDVSDGVGASLEHRSATTWPALSAVGERPGFDWSMQRGYEWVQLDRNDAAATTQSEREAMSHGVEVRASLWTHLEKTVFSGLAPVSDRSRLDAGSTPDRQDCE